MTLAYYRSPIIPDSLQTTLGLTIVNALTQQIRGTIDFSSDGGMEIKITFPERSRQRSSAKGKAQVLVVEDEAIVAEDD
jgi:hypothetical protein